MSELLLILIGFTAYLVCHHLLFFHSKADGFIVGFIAIVGAFIGAWLVFIIGFKSEESWWNTLIGGFIIALIFGLVVELVFYVKQSRGRSAD